MNIWICKRIAAALATALLLSGCSPSSEGAAKGPRFGLSRQAPETVTVARGAIVVGGPRGYCIDKGASRLRGNTAFVLMASCSAIMQKTDAITPDVPGILTVSVAGQTDAAPATSAVLDQMALFLNTPDGQATLARDGQADSVTILQIRREENAVLVQLDDRSTNTTPGLQPGYWRGFFDLNGRLITISVIGFERRPMPAENGLDLLRSVLARIRHETPTQNSTVTAPSPRLRLFRRLLN